MRPSCNRVMWSLPKSWGVALVRPNAPVALAKGWPCGEQAQSGQRYLVDWLCYICCRAVICTVLSVRTKHEKIIKVHYFDFLAVLVRPDFNHYVIGHHCIWQQKAPQINYEWNRIIPSAPQKMFSCTSRKSIFCIISIFHETQVQLFVSFLVSQAWLACQSIRRCNRVWNGTAPLNHFMIVLLMWIF